MVAGFTLSINQNIDNTVTTAGTPLRKDVYLKLLTDIYRGPHMEAVLPLFLQNANTVNILVIKLNSFSSLNLA